MKKYLAIVVSLAVSVLILGTGIVQAQDITAEGRAQQREERIEQYKQEAADRLSEAQQARIAGVCKSAQSRVERLESNLNTVTENRQRTYSGLADKLALVSDQLVEAGLDTTQLDAYISQMQLDAEAIVSSISEYQQILGDLANMDCESDVEGFQASLSVARSARSDLKNTAQGLKAYVQETIRPELQLLRQQLADINTEGGQ